MRRSRGKTSLRGCATSSELMRAGDRLEFRLVAAAARNDLSAKSRKPGKGLLEFWAHSRIVSRERTTNATEAVMPTVPNTTIAPGVGNRCVVPSETAYFMAVRVCTVELP